MTIKNQSKLVDISAPKVSLRHGFFKTQLLWFLGLALLPLLVVSVLTINNTQEQLAKEVASQLEIVSEHKARVVEDFFNESYRALLLLASEDRVVDMFKDLQLFHSMSGLTADKFVQSHDWEYLTQLYDEQFTPFMVSTDVYDLFLINENGDILYSFQRNADLGSNVFTGKLSQLQFGEQCQLAFSNEYPFFSDFEFYPPSGYIPAAFWITPIFDSERNKKGLLAVQIHVDKLNKVMLTGSEGFAESYFIGTDLLVRASSLFEGSNKSLSIKKDNKQSKMWLKEVTETDVNFSDNDLHQQTLLYLNLNGEEVLGAHHDVEIGQTKGAVITEIPSSKAFSMVRYQGKLALLIFFIATLLVIVIAFIAAKKVTSPLHRLAALAERVALGDLEIGEFYGSTNKNEFGLVEDSFTKVVNSVSEISDICGEISQGKINRKATIRGEKDVLARSVNTMVDNFKDIISKANAVAQGDYSDDISLRGEHDEIGQAINQMTKNLRNISEINQENDWFKTGQTQLAEAMSGGKNLEELANDIIGELAVYLDCPIGTFYVESDAEEYFSLIGSYSFRNPEGLLPRFRIGEGVIGEAARKKEYLLIKEVPENYMKLESSLGSVSPCQVIIIPLVLENDVKGVIELGALVNFTPQQIDFLKQLSKHIALAVHTAQESQKTRQLLEKTQAQAEELEVQQEELREANDRLVAQEEELRVSNEELSDKSNNLQQQKDAIEQSNRDLESAKQELLRKAKELETSSKYKSEFLANMSHELRTPLNSLLLISNRLSKNKEKNLTEKQIESARIIHSSGNDLLALINDILDLAKIEAGKMDVTFEPIQLSYIKENLDQLFATMAEEKNIEFSVTLAPGLPESIISDQQRIEQILRNLIGNAIKFTKQGSVSVLFTRPSGRDSVPIADLSSEQVVMFNVVDTGIGISTEKQDIIFDAFQQEDGTTSRQYGGTGLGLSITKELSHLLGGEISMSSSEGKGSTFTFFLPISPSDASKPAEVVPTQNAPSERPTNQSMKDSVKNYASSISDDRENIQKGEKTILVIEDDMNFAKFLYEVCHEKDFFCIHAPAGEKGLEMANKYLPSAIILDLGLPGIPGIQVLEMLKDNPATRHIPVQIISATEKDMTPLHKGAIGFLTKPVTDDQLDSVFTELAQNISREIKELLIVEDDPITQEVVSAIHASKDINITTCGTGEEAVQLISERIFDCVVLDLSLPGMSGFDVLKQISEMTLSHSLPPVVVHTGNMLTDKEQLELKKYTDSIVVKGTSSMERLLDETTLFLHAVDEDLKKGRNKSSFPSHDTDSFMSGKKVLAVDDDMRNLFALTDELEEFDIEVIKATNGKEALDVLSEMPDIDIVLMDIMMPVMNGFEAMQEIRKQQKFKNLPILALTAKAMREDRDRCIKAGANDYIPKPVDIERLISTMRVWLKD